MLTLSPLEAEAFSLSLRIGAWSAAMACRFGISDRLAAGARALSRQDPARARWCICRWCCRRS